MKKILVVVDMQNDFIDGALGTNEAKAIVNNAVKKINGFVGTVFATFDTHTPDYLQTAEGKKLPVPHCIKGTDGWLINPEIHAALDEKDYIAVEKPTFGSTALVERIRECCGGSDTEIELIGLCTDICVVSNALLLKANFPETKISVDSSCCAGVTPESHNAALTTMKMCQIDVI